MSFRNPDDGAGPVRRSRADLEKWFDALLVANGAALGRLAASYARHRADGEDLLQDIVLGIWTALPRFRGECSERTFLFRIAHNRAIAHISRRQLPIVDSEDPLEIEDAALDPESALTDAEAGECLLRAIQRLPIAYAQVVTLSLEGMTYVEIGDVLGISETNVGARLTRAREMLRKTVRSCDGR